MTDEHPVLITTRRSLHGVAELLLAGPQYAASGTIRLGIVPGGFGTVAEPSTRVVGAQAVGPAGAVDLDRRTPAGVAKELRLQTRSLADVYGDGPGVGPDEVLQVDVGAATVVAESFARGDQALRALAPEVVPVLWPEHFDLALTIDEVTYGVSPGDDDHPEPYAYVARRDASTLSGAFWNAPFGAARRLADLTDLRAFFEEGRSLGWGG
jgi:hypothetical protein